MAKRAQSRQTLFPLGDGWWYDHYHDALYDTNEANIYLGNALDRTPEWVQSGRRDIVNQKRGLVSVNG